MKSYFVDINGIKSNMGKMVDLLGVKLSRFNQCVITGEELKSLVPYLEMAQEAILKNNPRLKKVPVNVTMNDFHGFGWIKVNHQCLGTLKEVSDLPDDFLMQILCDNKEGQNETI